MAKKLQIKYIISRIIYGLEWNVKNQYIQFSNFQNSTKANGKSGNEQMIRKIVTQIDVVTFLFLSWK